MARSDLPDPLKPPNGDAFPLSRLAPGRRAIIERIDPKLPIGRRLRDLGFVPASAVTAVRRAPLGDPVAYEVRGTQLCLRSRDAQHVWVRVLDSSGE
jgi:Fe2+ transport system protein FeoA